MGQMMVTKSNLVVDGDVDVHNTSEVRLRLCDKIPVARAPRFFPLLALAGGGRTHGPGGSERRPWRPRPGVFVSSHEAADFSAPHWMMRAGLGIAVLLFSSVPW